MESYPTQEESNAMAAFLAAFKESLEERARLWERVVKLIGARPQEVVEQMEIQRGIK